MGSYKRLNLWISQLLIDKLKRIAYFKKKSMSAIVRELLKGLK